MRWRSAAHLLLCRLWISMMSLAQDGSIHILNILAELLHDGRKWQCVVHLFIQSTVQIQIVKVVNAKMQMALE